MLCPWKLIWLKSTMFSQKPHLPLISCSKIACRICTHVTFLQPWKGCQDWHFPMSRPMALCSSPCMLWQWAKSQCAHLSFLCYCQCTHLVIGTVSPENISLQASKSFECYVKIMLWLPVLSKMLNYNNVFIFIFYYWLFLHLLQLNLSVS